MLAIKMFVTGIENEIYLLYGMLSWFSLFICISETVMVYNKSVPQHHL
jgi:hypothetical protein